MLAMMSGHLRWSGTCPSVPTFDAHGPKGASDGGVQSHTGHLSGFMVSTVVPAKRQILKKKFSSWGEGRMFEMMSRNLRSWGTFPPVPLASYKIT